MRTNYDDKVRENSPVMTPTRYSLLVSLLFTQKCVRRIREKKHHLTPKNSRPVINANQFSAFLNISWANLSFHTNFVWPEISAHENKNHPF